MQQHYNRILNQPTILKISYSRSSKRNFQISYDLTSTTDFPSFHKNKSKNYPPDSTNDSPCDQASELSTLNTNDEKIQSIMEVKKSSIKSDIMTSFKSELNETLTNNNKFTFYTSTFFLSPNTYIYIFSTPMRLPLAQRNHPSSLLSSSIHDSTFSCRNYLPTQYNL